MYLTEYSPVVVMTRLDDTGRTLYHAIILFKNKFNIINNKIKLINEELTFFLFYSYKELLCF